MEEDKQGGGYQNEPLISLAQWNNAGGPYRPTTYEKAMTAIGSLSLSLSLSNPYSYSHLFSLHTHSLHLPLPGDEGGGRAQRSARPAS